MAYSFYGGKQGRTYRLVHHYDSIKQMVDAFQQGGSYNEVNYGEYVIIDTIANNHQLGNPQNGIIYRRGLNYTEIFNPNNLPVNENNTISKEDLDENNQKRYYIITTDQDDNELIFFDEQTYVSNFSTFVQNPGGGAEYVGQIVGPQGQAPQLSILAWDEFLEKYQSAEAASVHKASVDANPKPGVEFDENGDAIDGTQVDTITYGYIDMLDEYGNIVGSYISTDFPYSVFKYHAESIEPYDTGYATYDENEKVWKYTNLISEDEISQDHPFYWQYDIKVPKGVRGQDVEQFDIDIDPSLISEDGNDILPGEDNNNYRYYRIYRNYQRSAEGETTKEYLNSWQRTIHKITNNENGLGYPSLKRNTFYSQGDIVAAEGLKNNLYLKALTNGSTGNAIVGSYEKYEKGKTFTVGNVTWEVIEQKVTPPNLLTIHYTHGDNDQVKIRVVDYISYNDNGRFYVKYSDLDTLTYLGENQGIIGVEYNDTPWIDPNGLSHVIDRICIKYNTYNYDENGNIRIDNNFSLDSDGNLIFPTTDASGRRIQYIDEQFKFLDRVETDPDTKTVTAYYNDGTSNTLGVLRGIGKIYVENQGDLGKLSYLTVEYNNQQPDGSYQTEHVTNLPLNQVVAIEQYGDNIVLLYSDPQTRRAMFRQGIDYAIPRTTYNIPPGYHRESGDDDGNGNLYWINLGSIYKSNHIFSKFDSLTQLQQLYPYGFDKNTSGATVANMKDFAGWIATIDDGQGNVAMYAYDYRGNAGWYQLQDMSAVNVDPGWILLISQPDTTDTTRPPLAKDKLNNNGYWLVVSERAD